MAWDIKYYFRVGFFRAKEQFSDLSSTFLVYILYGFFIWLLSYIWQRFNSAGSLFSYSEVVLYIGITELLFMSFLSGKQITSSAEDFALFLARPRSWLGRELSMNLGTSFAKRGLFTISLIGFSYIFDSFPPDFIYFILRLFLILLLLSVPQALMSALFSTLRLTFPMSDYFILPFGKLFLALGGVFGPLSDYGEPWRSYFLKMPGSDLFFQPAHFVVKGGLYQLTYTDWIIRFVGFNGVLFLLVMYFYKIGRKNYQAWGG
ncbi:MAG TPA: hypothetical protein PLJ21_10065 [Pseudobdellovibrionaceae bacterium]|nr:hypothetical protein [Pseudobdellovibrionaceae bacterium]